MTKKTSKELNEVLCIDSSKNEVECKTLIVQGAKYKTLLTRKYINRKKWIHPDEKQILSFIPGTVLELFVRDGEKVQKNQPLLVLEAMKMENTIYAPFSGTIKHVNIKTKDIVPKGTIMVEFD